MPPVTERLEADLAGLARARTLLGAGELVAFPTETVYGLGADARQGAAVARIFEAKGRPRFNPLIVHVADLDTAERHGVFGTDAMALADAFWPGPLTLVVPLREDSGLSPLVSAGLETVGIRVPGGGVAQELLRLFDGPVAAPSANISGKVSPTRAEHVLDGLDGRIAAILDGGPAEVGVESTIIGCFDHPRMLRPGGLPAEAIEAALGRPLAHAPVGDTPNAPGQLASHYAPGAPVRLNVDSPEPGERLLGFGHVHGAALNLSPGGDLVEAAANLFDHLRRMDARGDAPIAVSPIPDHGLGRAINDRLTRAAAPRP
ncbi:translation factor SUA5 [Aliiruegeria haliotis]|uniref:Threonylcarbamoyl-AMP synthase n=1 Tax=Aliiruegeria haliotis TaxID=1280846 RepID=A0A2T0RTA5_9RHOB|nr:L-threonylcarbamoyladenylate synthase [Aliiruegeria haliotis]PRY24340.1 translation factor SUA5 [Aliiruegeria haliotis]